MRDLLYLDFQKACSIWSQTKGGLRERLSLTDESSKDRHAGTKFGIPMLADAKLGAEYAEKHSILESRILHHDLLNDVEAELETQKLVVDLSTSLKVQSAAETRAALGSFPYVRVIGKAVIEDYKQFLSISDKFNGIAEFISTCKAEAFKKTPEYLAIQDQLSEYKEQMKAITDRNKKDLMKTRINGLQETINKNLEKIVEVPEFLIKGIHSWIETFMADRLHLRIYPFKDIPAFQVICNLKRDCFVDENIEHLLYGYGKRPTVPLGVFGLITSYLPEEDVQFDPLLEYGEVDNASDTVAFEKAFRNVFEKIENLETLVRFARYPSIIVHPIAVFRSFDTQM